MRMGSKVKEDSSLEVLVMFYSIEKGDSLWHYIWVRSQFFLLTIWAEMDCNNLLQFEDC